MLRMLFIPFFLLAAIGYSCGKDAPEDFRMDPPITGPIITPGVPSSSSPKKYLALGDSYTIGQGVPPPQRYPVLAKDWLSNNGIGGLSDPMIIATTGWTTTQLQSAINAQNLTADFDVVSLLIGVNDQYQGKDTGGYRIRFTQLVQQSIALAKNLPAHVIVLSIPDYSVTPFAMSSDTAKIRKGIDEFNAINKEVSLSFNVQYLDITPLSRDAKNNPSLVAADGLHPSGAEYKLWAERLGPLMKTVLQ